MDELWPSFVVLDPRHRGGLAGKLLGVSSLLLVKSWQCS